MSKHVPAGWQVKPLEKIASTRTGKMNPLVDDKIKYIGLEHIDNGAITINGYMWSDATASLNSLFKKDDILFGKLRPYLRKCIQIGFDGCCSGELLVLKANCESANQNYLKCVLQSDPIYTFCDELSAGTKMPRVSWGDLKEFEVVLPPLTEQRKIAAILSSADRSIAATEKLIAKLADLKKALMQQLLTKGIGHPEFKPSPLGPIPKSWEVVELRKIANIIDGDRGKEYPKENDFIKRGACLFLSAKNITSTGFSLAEQVFISQEKDNKLRSGKLVRNDIIITTRGSVGNVALYSSDIVYDSIRINSGMAVVRVYKADAVLHEYLYQLMRSEVVQNQVELLNFGSAQPQLTIGIINELDISIPPISEQRKVADILNGVDRKLSAAKVKLAKAKDLKQGLMNDLLTGKVRVSV